MPADTAVRAVFFDFGGVIVDWDMRHLFRTVFDDEAEMEWFLANVLTPAENLRLDLGTPLAEIVRELIDRHPGHRIALEAWRDRWIETIPGPVEGTTEIVEGLSRRGVRLVGVSNFSTETFPLCRALHDVFDLFDDIVLSGDVGVAKPDPAIYRLACERNAVEPNEVVLVDDSPANVAGARAVGLHALLFVDAQTLRRDLAAFGLVLSA
jgi:2-haloacid dehalogenase